MKQSGILQFMKGDNKENLNQSSYQQPKITVNNNNNVNNVQKQQQQQQQQQQNNNDVDDFVMDLDDDDLTTNTTNNVNNVTNTNNNTNNNKSTTIPIKPISKPIIPIVKQSPSKLNLKNISGLSKPTNGNLLSSFQNATSSQPNITSFFTKVDPNETSDFFEKQLSATETNTATPDIKPTPIIAPSTPSKSTTITTPIKKPASKPTPKKQATSNKRKMVESDDDYEEEEDEEDDDDDYVSDEDYEEKTKSKSKSKSKAPSTPKKSTASSSSSISLSTTPSKNKKQEERYSFLVDIKDGNGIKKGEPDYDPSTIYVPAQFREGLTAFEKQYWDIKSQNYDKIVFFKKGKFYELYENDADVGHQLFDLKMTDRVNMRMVGVPEMSFQHWAKKFLEAGYKVTKVDQVESRLAMDKRQNLKGAASQKDTIIQREVTSVLTIGTLVDDALISDSSANFLMAIKEDEYKQEIGVCFVDSSVGIFHLTEFKDDENRTHLETLLLQTMPKEVLYEKSSISHTTLSTIKRILSREKYLLTTRQPNQFWGWDFTFEKLKSFERDEEFNRSIVIPTTDLDTSLMVVSLGACISYLEDIKIVDQVIRQSRFERYSTLDGSSSLVLDGQSIINLELFANTTDGSTSGSLFKVLDRCCTPFGKRQLKQWVCRPLSSKERINERLDVVQYLGENSDLMKKLNTMLTRVPDLERMVSRIRACTSKIQDLVNVLNVMEKCQQSLEELECIDEITSNLLKNYITIGKGFPNLKEIISELRQSFTFQGETLVPSRGIVVEYDQTLDNITKIEKELEQYLKDQKKLLNSNILCYKHMGKELYQLEIPTEVFKRNASKMGGYIYKSELKSTNVKRYYTSYIEQKVQQLAEEKDSFAGLEKIVIVKLQEQFNVHLSTWNLAVNSLCQIDCLLSLAKVSHQAGITTCRPEVVVSDNAFLEAREMRHPAITLKGGDDFIPNDVSLGTDAEHPRVMVLTGPNMGGKSTLLRQCCILVIMAQLGCYVPAESCRMSIVDRIFTRLGANDNIMAGQSTFMLELQETSNVLRYATKKSFVIMDELGRGTSTFDGYSIAYSVLNQITKQINCLCIFATHYQSLANEPKVSGLIQKSHMSCWVDNEERKVIFLYKLADGVCPASYGMLVGGMAGIPKEVIQKAEEKAEQFEKESTVSSYVHGTTSTKELVRKIALSVKSKDYDKLVELWKSLDIK